MCLVFFLQWSNVALVNWSIYPFLIQLKSDCGSCLLYRDSLLGPSPYPNIFLNIQIPNEVFNAFQFILSFMVVLLIFYVLGLGWEEVSQFHKHISLLSTK